MSKPSAEEAAHNRRWNDTQCQLDRSSHIHAGVSIRDVLINGPDDAQGDDGDCRVRDGPPERHFQHQLLKRHGNDTTADS
ncbi:MAG: hypothetical protein QUV05_10710 [Phycisphaerae bacterium]|nr:hypothetical protein [Phycisphaerae bacterium]